MDSRDTLFIQSDKFESKYLIPVRVGLCGDWGDHPMLNSYYPVSAIAAAIEPRLDDGFDIFNGGLATSTHKSADMFMKMLGMLYGGAMPPNPDPKILAELLYTWENKPDHHREKPYVSGTFDSYGIVFPGINRFHYDDNYQPHQIESITDEEHLKWLESVLYLVPTLKRTHSLYRPKLNQPIVPADVKELADASEMCWTAIGEMNVSMLAHSLNACKAAHSKIIPNMYENAPADLGCLGWKYSGAGGGGYIVAVSERPMAGSTRIKIRRDHQR